MQAVTKRADCGTGLEGMTPENGVSPINAPGPGASDEVWVANAVHNIDAYHDAVGSAPDQAVLAIWTKHPTHILSISSLFTACESMLDRQSCK